MGRETRRVPKNWTHPTRPDGQHVPLLAGYAEDIAEFKRIAKTEGIQRAVEYFGGVPDERRYMPTWSEEEADHIMMYENVSEGTPISPAFKTPEELARWLADNRASAFGDETATYDQWLGMIRAGSAPSAVLTGGVLMSGVAATKD